nr:hypothetical protein [Tanacetum cinerariifolium]
AVHLGQLVHEALGLRGVFADKHGERAEAIEEKVRVDLLLELGELALQLVLA